MSIPSTSTSRFTPIAASVAAFVMLAAPLSPTNAAQPMMPGPARKVTATVPELLEKTNSPDWKERQTASSQLENHPDATLDVLLNAAGDPERSPEQHARLTQLAWERFATTPRAALGISFQRGFVGGMQSGAVIEGTFAEFDSSRVLKPGDTIYSMDEVRIQSMDDGKRVIQSHEPGERVMLRVFRDGQPIIVRLTLGSLTVLNSKDNNFGQQRVQEPAVTRDAFRLRLERSIDPRSHATPIDLARLASEPHAAPKRAEQLVAQPTQPTPHDDADELPTSIAAGGKQGTIVESQFDRFSSNPQDLQLRVTNIMRQLQIIDRQLLNTDEQLADPNVVGERRARAEKYQKDLFEKRAKLKLELSGLQQ